MALGLRVVDRQRFLPSVRKSLLNQTSELAGLIRELFGIFLEEIVPLAFEFGSFGSSLVIKIIDLRGYFEGALGIKTTVIVRYILEGTTISV
jgi:hypothetical protein